jgi:antitoxin (DNA-binding transcriptional repressor) of toxin-antitoxin stability system
MQRVNISEFRTNLLKYLKQAQKGEQITITSNDQSLAIIAPPIDQHDAAKAKLNKIAETAIIHDVLTPTNEDWDVLS